MWVPRLALAIAVILSWTIMPPLEVQAEEIERHCFGWLWCMERQDGAVSTDVLFYLYSSEQRGAYSRLAIRPLYSQEDDPTRDLLRRSFFWPLGTYERVGGTVSSRIFPLYWHGEEPGQHYTFALPLYFDYVKGDRSYFHLFPLYSHHAQGGFFDQRFYLGPLLISTHDTRLDLARWDFLFPLGGHSRHSDGADTWLFPVYFSGHQDSAGRDYRFILPFYGNWESPRSSYRFLFPVFGSEQDNMTHLHRFSFLGLPPLPGARSFPTLAMYEHTISPETTTNRLFPIYRYATDGEGTQFDALLLFQHRVSVQGTANRLFPLYNFEDDHTRPARDVSIFGYRQFSVFQYSSDPAIWQHRLIPLYSYGYETGPESRTLGILGVGGLSLFQHRSAPGMVSDRLFPVYSYDQPREGELHASVMGIGPLALYQHHTLVDTTRDRFFPLYDYRRDGEDRTFSGIGYSELAFFRLETSPELFRHRFFPLYRYRHDLIKGETEYDTLFLYRHLSSPMSTADRLLPFWDYASRKKEDEWRIDLLGLAPLTLYHHESGPSLTTDRFFPLYGYRGSASDGRRLSVLGLPPTSDRFAWALYEHTSKSSLITDRLFPLYKYAENDQTGEREWNVLLLYQHRGTATLTKDALFPLHWFEHDMAKQAWQLSLLGIEPLTLFRYRTSPVETTDHLVPLYAYHRDTASQRFSLLGFPPVGALPSLSLYEHTKTATRTTDRFVPLYAYTADRMNDETSLTALLMFWHTTSPTRTQDSFLPVGSFMRDQSKDEWRLSLFGLDPIMPVSWFRQTVSPSAATGLLFPIYDYRRDSDDSSLSIGGVSELALYRHQSTLALTRDRFFPLYAYRHELRNDASSLQVLVLYQHDVSPEKTRDRFFPVWGYEQDHVRGEMQAGVLGTASFALYQHHRTVTKTTDRFFPLYSYTADHTTGQAEFELLWPFVDYKSRNGQTTEVNLLWWLGRYEHPEADTYAYQILGGSKIALLQRVVSPERTLFEINPIIPLYASAWDKSKGSSWTLLGGLVGMESTEDQRSRLRLLWMF